MFTFEDKVTERNNADKCALCETPLCGAGNKSACGYYLCDECIADEDVIEGKE